MRRIFALSLIALLLGVGVVALIETDPGYVLISHGNYTLESSLWVGLLVLAAGLFLFFQLLRLLYGLVSGRRSLVNWWGARQTSQALKSTTQGLISYTEGNWTRARRLLLRGAEHHEASFINFLLAARASDRLEEPERVVEYLQAASDAEPEGEAAIAIVRAENQLHADQYARAAETLKAVRGSAGKHPYALSLLQRAYEGLGRWDDLLALLPELVKHKQITAEASARLLSDIHFRRLQVAATAAELHTVWQSMSAELRHDIALLRLYVSRQIALGDQEGAEKSIARGLKRHWDSELVRQYAFIDNEGNISGRLRKAERWLQEHPEDPQLLLCLGRLCLQERLWGKARDYFERSYRADRSGEVCAELGRLLISQGELKLAAAYYREGLAASTAVLPDLPMPDKVVTEHHLLERDSSS